MVSPHHLVNEALDRGFKSGADSGSKKASRQEQKTSRQEDDQGQESEDEISREKKEAARKHYGMRRSPSQDDVAITKQRIKAEAKAGAAATMTTATTTTTKGGAGAKFTGKDSASSNGKIC